MNNEKEPKQVETETENWAEQVRKIALASMGAMAMAQDEFEKFVNKLIERGELAEQEGRSWIKEFLSKGRQQTKEAVDAIEENSLENFEKILQKLNIPTKKDFNKLADKLEELSQRVNKLVGDEEKPKDSA